MPADKSNTIEVSEARRSLTNKPERNTNIDVLRLVAAFGVINIHVPFTTDGAARINAFFSPLCVPFFFLTSLVYFLSGLTDETTLKEVLNRSVKRLLLPYLAWTVIYTLLIIVKHAVVHQPNDIVWYQVLFYGQSSVQLYFLPQLFAMQMVMLSIFFMFSSHSTRRVTGVIILLAAIAFYAAGNLLNCFGIVPFDKLIFYMVSASLALAVINNPVKWIYGVLGVLIVLIPAIIGSWEGRPEELEKLTMLPFIGLGLVLIALGFPLPKLPRFIAKLTGTSFGIYLSHIVFLEAILFALNRFFPGRVEFNAPNNLMITAIVFIIALVFTLLAEKVSFLRQYLLGLKPAVKKRYKKRKRRSSSATTADAAG